MDCRKFDEQVVRLEQISEVAREFVLVRLLRIAGADLNLFEFDYDLTWAGFFMNAEEKVYGRYGSRDASGPDGRLSLAGLRFAMERALDAHRRAPKAKPERRLNEPQLVENYPAAQRRRRQECIHCHQVYEFRRDQLQSQGKWNKEQVWVYPLPENVGLTLTVDRGNHVRSVAPGSAADRTGVRAGDVLQSVNGFPVASIADVQFGLHRAPARGTIPLTWQREGKSLTGALEVNPEWRRTNITWRPSLLDVLPSLGLFGEDLPAEEKKAIGLTAKRLAFRQEKRVPKDLRTAGVQAGDIVLGIDNQLLEMSMEEFLGHVRRNFLVGEKVTLNLVRNGERVDVPFTLR